GDGDGDGDAGGGGNGGGQGNGGDGGGAVLPQAEHVDPADFLFWVGQKKIQVQQRNNRVISLEDEVVTIGIDARELPNKEVQKMVATVDGKEVVFVLHNRDNRFYADIPLPGLGVHDVAIQVLFKDGTVDRIRFQFEGVGHGRVVERGKDLVLPGTKVVLLDMNAGGHEWDAAAYGQQNPIIVGDDGSYGFVVPNGKYKLVATLEGYKTRKTLSFVVDNNIINDQITLIKKAETFEEALAGADTTIKKVGAAASVVGQIFTEQTQVATEKVADVARKANEL
ncbi:MAG: hypothetical protein COU33_03150, partial [Candidatus Magasanikbacteria bacterium CG10_big_fil_rev_8_21_14_0_10_43_6]